MTPTPTLSPARRGIVVETLFAAEVMARGGWFYPSADSNDQVDCVVRSDAGVYRVQIKYTGNRWANFRRGKHPGDNAQEYTAVDLFAVLASQWLIIPRDFITSQTSRIKRLETYADAWHLLGLSLEKYQLN